MRLKSHIAVASIGKPMATLNRSIHAPGLGPSSSSLKSSLVRLFTIWPCLSLTVASTLTTLTSEEKVGVCWPRNGRYDTSRDVRVANRIQRFGGLGRD